MTFLIVVPLLAVWALWLAWQGRWAGAEELTAITFALSSLIASFGATTRKTKIAWYATLAIFSTLVWLLFRAHPGLRLD
jgi:hypothetical protein